MILTKLLVADIYRDGGSYCASFETDDNRRYNIWLQRSKMPDEDGLHHRWLHEYFGERHQDGDLRGRPIVTGSEAECLLLSRLNKFLTEANPEPEGEPASASNKNIRCLRELIKYIGRREPCFPSDLEVWRSN